MRGQKQSGSGEKDLGFAEMRIVINKLFKKMGNLIPRHHHRSHSKSLNLIPCCHDRNSMHGSFEVKLRIVKKERLLYHYPDGSVVEIKRHISTDGRSMYAAVSGALNPIDCTHCKAFIIEFYDNARVRGDQFSGVEALNHLHQVALKLLRSGRYPTGFDVAEDLGLTVEVHVYTTECLIAWLDRHRSPSAATGRAIVTSLERVVPLDIGKEACCVCLEGLGDEDGEESKDKDMEMETGVLMKMSCGHTFHGHCILEWLLTSPHCPLCRSKI
ncbi:hypothetical protein Cgig2_019354 [Carnegiea gigantea]|uniref:RING-type E3 ubiquitin transferase n=1 Tax=Carnegiea gigantea TaxID=171969 RepID=A0A9Q1JG91_9CARY|nr:hypothetical protein Cgig2_019354 [Carnegiea gigantea]